MSPPRLVLFASLICIACGCASSSHEVRTEEPEFIGLVVVVKQDGAVLHTTSASIPADMQANIFIEEEGAEDKVPPPHRFVIELVPRPVGELIAIRGAVHGIAGEAASSLRVKEEIRSGESFSYDVSVEGLVYTVDITVSKEVAPRRTAAPAL